MKKSALITLFLILGLFVGTSSAVEVTRFGPTQYVRTGGAPDVYNESFSAPPGEARLVVTNGEQSGTHRVTDGVSSAYVRLNGEEIFGPNDFNQTVYQLEGIVTLVENNSLSVELNSNPDSYITVSVLQEAVPPTVSMDASPGTIDFGEPATLTWSSTGDTDTASIDQGVGTVPVDGSTTVSPTETTTYTITVTGPGGIATDSATVAVINPSPTVSISATPEDILYGESVTLSWSSTDATSAIIEPDIGSVTPNDSTIVSPERTTTYTITVTGPGGSASDQVMITVSADVVPPPEGSFGEQYEDQIPPDATVGEYDSKRFSLITGLVRDLSDLPIADVSITILDHPEYGTAFTDSEGKFSIPVEGGGTMTVVYQKEVLIPVQRKVYVPWNDIAVAETIQMISEDPAATTLTFDGNPSTVIAHESTEVTDEFGSRSCTMVFTGDNHAYAVDAQGNVIQELTTITTRATEFPTPESMPAILPPTSAFTYCVEQRVDGVKRVRFDKPVITWVDNFLGFNVGEIVPVGYYDQVLGVWVPENNGLVVALLDTNADGLADSLDSTGDGAPNDLDGDGVYSDEVQGLDDPGRYPAGSTFWRVAVTHFSPRDLNWPRGLPTGAIDPNPPGQANTDQKLVVCDDCQSPKIGSYIEERSRILHEDIPIPGTDMTLHYASNRVRGYGYKITVPASGDSVPASLERIVVRVRVAGRSFEEILDPLPNQMAEFTWDGLDHLGRPVINSVPAHIRVKFVYQAVYYVARNVSQAFGVPGTGPTEIPAREEMTLSKDDVIFIHIDRSHRTDIAEGWTLSVHHHLSATDLSTLQKGNGTTALNSAVVIDTAVGTGTSGFSGDLGPATEAKIRHPWGVAVDASGSLYFADSTNNRIRKVDPNGIITTVAGKEGPSGFSGDGGPATEAQLSTPLGVAVDNSGNIYITDSSNHRIRKVDSNGIITTVAGNGIKGYGGDGGPATQASLRRPFGVAADALGNVYIADTDNHRIRRVDPSGIITTVAGNGAWGFSGDGGKATDARLYNPYDVALDSAGNLYIADRYTFCVRKVDPSGIITTVAGTGGQRGYSGDGGPATEARFNQPISIDVDTAGNLYIVDHDNHRLRKVDTTGIISTIVGTGVEGLGGDGGLATEAELYTPAGVAVDPSGNIYIAQYYGYRIRKVGPVSALAGYVTAGEIPFAEENGLGHIMSSGGQHLRTIDLDTGIILYEFDYNSESQLVSITDRFNNQTVVNRDSDGVPLSITSPDGITTTLTVDQNNHLTGITYPDGGYYTFEYTQGGLVTTKVEPEGNRYGHTFDSIGRLTTATDEEGGNWQFSRNANENGDILAEILTAEGDLTFYLDYYDSAGGFSSTITDPTGSMTSYSQSGDGLTVNKSLPCGLDLHFEYGIDPEYKFKFVKEMTESTPSGLTRTTSRGKTYQDTDSDETPDRSTETVTVNGKTTTLVTDTLQAKKTITSPVGRTITTNYNPNTLLTTSLVIPGLYDTTYGYDTKGRLTSIATNTRQTTFAYDAQGNLSSITDPKNQTTSYSYDAVGRMTGISRPDTSSVAFTYDKNGNMTVLTNPANIDHGFSYNLVNLNSSYTTPLSGSYNYVYDKDRRLIQVNFPSGKQINNLYGNGRLEQIQTPTLEDNIYLTYLCGNKVDTITKGTEAISYGYDGSLVTAENLSGTLNESLSYTNNNDFNLTSFTYAGGTVSYGYENDGLLTNSGVFTVSRDAGNGLPEAVTGGALNLSRTFNGYGEVAGEDFTVGSQGVTSWSLTRDNAGRITTKTETVNGLTSSYDYTYDPMGRLLTVTKDSTLVEEYVYDSVGTRTYEMNSLRGISGRTFTYDDEDHLLTVGDASYQYDLDGYLTNKTVGTEQPYEVTTYSYSSRGELLSVTLPDGTPIEYVHDPLGRRIAKKVNGVITEKYLWQGLTRLLAVYDGNDFLLTRFLYADGRMPVAMEQGGTTYYLTYDQVGSLRVVADAVGNVIKNVDYDSFGNIINDTNPAFEIPFGFAGGLQDRDTGLVRFGFRDYDPDVGRWTAKDPVGFWGGDVDLYGYCFNDPVNWVDPSGRVPALLAIPAAAIAAEGAAGAVAGVMAGTIIGKWISDIVLSESGGEGGEDIYVPDDKPCPKASESSPGTPDPDKDRTTAEKIRDITRKPKDWKKVAEKLDPRQPRNGKSIRELWRHKTTGETLERHVLEKGGKVPRGHPHYKEPVGW